MMEQENSSASPRALVPWRWLAGAVLVVAAVGGLFIAESGGDTAAYAGGLALFVAATLVIFGLVSTIYGRSPLLRLRWFPANGTLRWALGGAVGILAIAGLLHAAKAEPETFGYYDGIGLFLVATAYDFMLLKDWFDTWPRRPMPD